MADSKSKAKDERTADEIRRDIAATRARLAAGVENLVEEVHPATLKREASDRARDFVQGEFDQVKSQVKDENGWRAADRDGGRSARGRRRQHHCAARDSRSRYRRYRSSQA